MTSAQREYVRKERSLMLLQQLLSNAYLCPECLAELPENKPSYRIFCSKRCADVAHKRRKKARVR